MRRALLLTLALGCAQAAPPAPTAPQPPLVGDPLGPFRLTYYWVTTEVDFDGEPDTEIYDLACVPLAVVPATFAKSLALEGTGRLRDGRLLNFAALCSCPSSPCYLEVDGQHPWGIGVLDRALAPFRSVAVDPNVVTIGARLYVADLDGLRVPGEPPWGGFVHDGCVVADDRGGAIAGRHIDFFAALKPYYLELDGTLGRRTVMIYDGGGRCPGAMPLSDTAQTSR